MTQGCQWSRARAHAIIDAHRAMRGALLPILHGLQSEFGYIPDDALPVLAERLNLSQAEILGVVSFYHDFRRTQPGRHVIKVCRAEACQAMGAEALLEHTRRHLNVDVGDTTPDKRFTLETVFCLGNCALGPSVMIDDQLHGRVTPTHVEALIQSHRSATS